MSEVEKSLNCEELLQPDENIPQELIDRFWDKNRVKNYVNMLKERKKLSVETMARQTHTPDGTAKNFHNGRSKHPRLPYLAQYVYLNDGSLDEMFYPEGTEARNAEATKALKEMYESQSALQVETFEKQISDIKEVNEKAMADLVEAHKVEIAELNETHKKEIMEINACHRQELTDMAKLYHDKAETQQEANNKILNIAVFDKKWFRILSCILAVANVILLITLTIIITKFFIN